MTKIKILLIEDNPGDVRLIQEILKEADPVKFILESESRLSKGLANLNSGNFHLLLLDLNLPDSKGLNTIKTALKETSNVPIVVFTSIDDEDTGIEALKEGAQDYLIKGQIRKELLVRAIHYAIERQKLKNKMELMKEEFLAIMAHDLKSPLSTIKSYAEILEEPEFGEICEEKTTYTKNIHYLCNMQLALIDNIVHSAKINAGKMKYCYENFSLKDLLSNLFSVFEAESRNSKIMLEMDCSNDIFVFADHIRMEQVFQNLISNAFRYTREEGRISISAYPEKGRIKITVSDTGIGIPAKEQEQLFQKYGQTEGKQFSSGLGLFIVKNILLAHNSEIKLESEEGKGTTFLFSLEQTSWDMEEKS